MIRIVRGLGGAAVDFVERGCMTLAASVAFFAVLSLPPMVFLLLSMIRIFVSHESLGQDYVLTFLHGFIPSMWPQMAAEIERVASETTVQRVVLVTFLWFASLVFYELDYAIHVVFGCTDARRVFSAALRSIGLLALVGPLLLLSFLLTKIMDELISLAELYDGLDVAAGAASQLLVSYLLPFLLVLITGTILYRAIPRTPPGWGVAFIGGLFFALLWELAKHVFTNYVQDLSMYGRMYGSLLAMVLFLLWIYYSAALFLFGAALVRRLQLSADRRTVVPARVPAPSPAPIHK